jgi:hypothetical protein
MQTVWLNCSTSTLSPLSYAQKGAAENASPTFLCSHAAEKHSFDRKSVGVETLKAAAESSRGK